MSPASEAVFLMNASNRRSSSAPRPSMKKVSKRESVQRKKKEDKQEEKQGDEEEEKEEKQWIPSMMIRREYRRKIQEYKQYLKETGKLDKKGDLCNPIHKYTICADIDCSSFGF